MGRDRTLTWLSCAVLVLTSTVLVAVACERDVDYLEPATDSRFQPGQVWRYQTRPGEESSRLVVAAVDRVPKLGRVVHIQVWDVSLGPGARRTLPHLPMQEEALLRSVVELEGSRPGALRSGYEESYGIWLDAFDFGKAIVYTTSVRDAVEHYDAARRAPPARS